MSLTWDQVSAITAKKFLPKCVDNIFDSNPFFERQKRKNTLKLDGGTKIIQPLNYAQISSAGWYSGSETLDTSDNETITGAEYDWKFLYVNMTILRSDELKNAGSEGKLKLAKQKMEQAEKTMSDLLGVGLYNDGTDAKALGGLRLVVNTSGTVGGISQSSYSWWQAQVDSTTTTMTMGTLQSQFTAASIGSDSPTVGMGTRSNYDRYYALLQPQQRFMDGGSAKAGFSSLMFNGVPILADSNCPTNHLFFLNEKYIPLVVHRDENFRMEPFVKPVNQNVRIGKIYWCGNLAPSNNRMQSKFSALAA